VIEGLDHEIHAAHVHVHSIQNVGGIDALLDGAKFVNHCADEIDQS
jgi:hypothetical protein